MKRSAALVALALLLAGCKDHEFAPPSREQRVAEAETVYSSAAFDTIRWDSAGARRAEGNLVYATHCRRCHGATGEGDTEYAREQELAPPSLVRADWTGGSSIDTVRHRIFVGHRGGMPTMGIATLTPREIDAAAAYIVEQLRPEALSGQ